MLITINIIMELETRKGRKNIYIYILQIEVRLWLYR